MLLLVLVFGFCALWQVYLWFWVLLPPPPRPLAPVLGVYPSVCLLICARNEAPALAQNLPLWLNLTYLGPWQILLVDDGSQDGTAELLADYQQRYPQRLRVLTRPAQAPQGKSPALRQGLAEVQTDLVWLSDADCFPASPQALSRLVEVQQQGQKDLVLGFSPYLPSKTLLGLCIACETLFTALQYGSAAAQNRPYMGLGRNLLYTRQAAEQLPPLPQGQISGDDDLGVQALLKQGFQADYCLNPASFTHSPPKTTWADWFKQKQRHLSAAPHYPFQWQVQLGLLAFSHTGFWLLLPWALTQVSVWLCLSLIILRQLGLYRSWKAWAKALGQEKLSAFFWFFDFFIPFYHCIFAPTLFIKRRTHWK